MKHEEVRVDQLAFVVTMRCTLKCKHCLVFAPYYENPVDYSLDILYKSIEKFFEVVDSVGVFNVQGGEPFMHKDLSKIIEKVLSYSSKIERILLTTNGTLLPSNDVLKVLIKHNQQVSINISDYGRSLSRKVDELTRIFQKNNISYHINKYWGSDAHYGGWIDFTNHTIKCLTDAETAENAKYCGNRSGSTNLAVRLGELYYCFRNTRRIDLGIIEKNTKSCVDLFNDLESVIEKRKQLNELLNAPFSPGCKYCVGKRKDLPHIPAAEQLSQTILPNEVEVI